MTTRGMTGKDVLQVNPQPTFDLSPNLFMQFMEPLGTADPSIEAGWDFRRHCWREDLVKVTRELAPPLIRWPGGCFTSYYRWKEAIGPLDKRKPVVNLCWGGIESNHVGTHEFIDFCRQVRADPLIAVNFEADGRKNWARPPGLGVRTAGPAEAAEWVDYCNNPANRLRKRHGAREPFGVRLWQIGNETSYDRNGYDCETTARRTVAFAKAMRKADPDIDLIGWGDSGWAPRMAEVAGEHLQYLAFHPGFGLRSAEIADWPDNPAKAWNHLMACHKVLDERIRLVREQVAGCDIKLACTEGHFFAGPRGQNPLLRTWAAGVANARALNVQARHGDVLKIATAADFCGNRWENNAVMIARGGFSYMMPVARVMSLFRRHMGRKAVAVARAPRDLDVTAGRTGTKVYLHVVNTNRTRDVRANLRIDGMKLAGGKAFQIADDPWRFITDIEREMFAPLERRVPANGNWTFPAASVTAIELAVEPREARG